MWTATLFASSDRRGRTEPSSDVATPSNLPMSIHSVQFAHSELGLWAVRHVGIANCQCCSSIRSLGSHLLVASALATPRLGEGREEVTGKRRLDCAATNRLRYPMKVALPLFAG